MQNKLFLIPEYSNNQPERELSNIFLTANVANYNVIYVSPCFLLFKHLEYFSQNDMALCSNVRREWVES